MRNKHCLITGGRSGIGAAVAGAMLSRGARLSLLDLYEADRRSEQALELACDVSDSASIRRAVEKSMDVYGDAPDILVNCAGVTQVPKPTTDVDDANWERVIDINLKGTFLACREVGRHMAVRGSGAIVNIASVTGMGGFPCRTAYGPSKAGVINLTEALSLEWAGSGIRVNAVSPGYVATAMVQTMIDGGAFTPDAVIARIPLKRMADPGEIATAVVFLASSEASYITGVTLPVDGGWLANRAP